MKDALNRIAFDFMSVYNPQFFCEVVVPILSGMFN